MKVTEIQPYGRSGISGNIVGGRATFSDGKEWQFTSANIDDLYFTIASGVPSQWSMGDFGRNIAPKKRVEALHHYLTHHYEKCLEETDPMEAACIHCGKLKRWVDAEGKS